MRAVPEEDVRRGRFRVHRDAGFREDGEDSVAGDARRRAGASLCGGNGDGDAGAEFGGDDVPVEGTEGAGSDRGASGSVVFEGASVGGNVQRHAQEGREERQGEPTRPLLG